MGLPKEYAEKLKTLVRRAPLTLPELGMDVVVRGLMSGEIQRVQETKGMARQNGTMIALATEHPSSGEPLWSANVLSDMQEIDALHALDMVAMIQKINELSGSGKMEALLSDQSKSSGAYSPSDSAAPSGS